MSALRPVTVATVWADLTTAQRFRWAGNADPWAGPIDPATVRPVPPPSREAVRDNEQHSGCACGMGDCAYCMRRPRPSAEAQRRFWSGSK